MDYHYKEHFNDFPLEILERMQKEQILQKQPADLTVFYLNRSAGVVSKGFDWSDTDAGREFWSDVITKKILLDSLRFILKQIF